MRRIFAAIRPVAGIVIVGILGAWLALLLVGPLRYRLGPFEVEMFARPGPGLTEIRLPPFGRVIADSHTAPLRLSATLDEVRAPEITDVVERGGTPALVETVEVEGRSAVARHSLRAVLVAATGGVVLGALAFRRRWRAVAGAGLAAAIALGGTGLIVRQTYRPDSFLQPTYTGSLTLAPRLLGPIRDATGQIEDFRAELERVVSGAVRAYGVVAAQPPSASRVVALHIGDLHASPVGMDLAVQLAQSFDVDVVIDTGDITSFNTPLERTIVDRIPEVGAPYVFVRGNHDSAATAAQMERSANVDVLDGEVRDIGGLRIFGIADPELTPANPDRASDEERARLLAERGRDMGRRIAALPEPPHVIAVHDDRIGGQLAGQVPLVVSGHFHRADARVLEQTLFLRVGTTGAGGFDPYARGEVTPLSAEILYFDGEPLRLVAFDVVTLNPETRDLQVKRTLTESLLEEAPVPAPTLTPGG